MYTSNTFFLKRRDQHDTHTIDLVIPPIGGERVVSKLNNYLGRTKRSNSLGKQQLELHVISRAS